MHLKQLPTPGGRLLLTSLHHVQQAVGSLSYTQTWTLSCLFSKQVIPQAAGYLTFTMPSRQWEACTPDKLAIVQHNILSVVPQNT